MKNLHLIISVLLLTPIAFVYGFAHDALLSSLFDFKVVTTDLHDVFRAMMGLYAGMIAICVAGVFNPRYWKPATILNIVFMGGLACGRIISFLADGTPSVILLTGFFAEVFLSALSYFNLREYGRG